MPCLRKGRIYPGLLRILISFCCRGSPIGRVRVSSPISLPSLIAEMMTAAMGVQGMKWETSPAAAELEEQVMDWLKGAIGLPGDFQGTIQDSASTATLVSILTAREKKSGYAVNERGLYDQPVFRVYCSEETH